MWILHKKHEHKWMDSKGVMINSRAPFKHSLYECFDINREVFRESLTYVLIFDHMHTSKKNCIEKTFL